MPGDLDPEIELKLGGGEKFAELAKKLRGAANKPLRQELNKAIRAATKPAVADVKAAVKSIDSKVTARSSSTSGAAVRARHAGSSKSQAKKSHGLRETIASAIQTKITSSGYRTGIRIRVDGTKLPEDQRTLPKALDKPEGWRHPVFGDPSVWVQQSGRPWFELTIRHHAREIRQKILAAMHSISERL